MRPSGAETASASDGTVHQVEGMRQADVAAALALAGFFPLRASEQVQEAALAHVGIGDLHRAVVFRHFGELETDAGRQGDGVGQRLGAQAAGDLVGEVAVVMPVPPVGAEGGLVDRGNW